MTEVIIVTEEQVQQAKQNALDKLGITWEQLKSFVDDCGCCITLPKEFDHLNEWYVRDVWWAYRN